MNNPKTKPAWVQDLPKLPKHPEPEVQEYEVFCSECGKKMKLRHSPKYDRYFYGCSGFPDCRGIHGAHPDGKPLGIPANKETRGARIRAHDAFDQLWKQPGGRMSRGQAYAWMKHSTGFQHIGELTLEQCEQLCAALLVTFDIEAK